MTSSLHERLAYDPTVTCAVDFLTTHRTAGVAYMCGRCLLIGARGDDEFVYTDEGDCAQQAIDALDHDLQREDL